MQNLIIDQIEKKHIKKRPNFRVGDRVSVSVRLKEGDKERVQVFRGVVITKQPKSGNGPRATFTVRKISEGVGVERIFPLHSPIIEGIEVEASSNVRQSRLYYLRGLKGKKARLKTAEKFGDEVLAQEETKVETAPVAEAPAVEEAPAAAAKDKKEKK